MKRFTTLLLVFATLSLAAPVASQAPTGFPFSDEDLNYSIRWPGGADLGEAHLHAHRSGAASGGNWKFEMTLDAGVPGFPVTDSYRSETTPDYCSTFFQRTTTHGPRTAQEKETINRDRAIATRQTTSKDGGTSDLPVPACVKDALAYLFYARTEMGQGRVPASQDILFGNLYHLSVAYVGGPMITVNQKQVQADQITCTFRGKSGDYSFDVYFARDAARTPLLVTAPFAMGKFSMELIR